MKMIGESRGEGCCEDGSIFAGILSFNRDVLPFLARYSTSFLKQEGYAHVCPVDPSTEKHYNLPQTPSSKALGCNSGKTLRAVLFCLVVIGPDSFEERQKE
jgi:hypothetical protein